MRIAVTGSRGQLGLALAEALSGHDLLPLDLPDHDITDLEATRCVIAAHRPEWVIHGAAMTDVDGCERDPDAAYRVNVMGTRNVAVAARECDAALAYISTDYVYDGERRGPYREDDPVNPLSVYARTKWLGEETVRRLVWRHYVVRVAWLYGEGPRNFVRTVLRLADERGALQMVTDEVGSPTYARDVAEALPRLCARPAYGTYHLPNAGVCSRYEWAREILRLTGREQVPLQATTNYPRAARVPRHVALHNVYGAALGIVMRPWQDALADYLAAQGMVHGRG